jgi:putative hemolysin
MTSVAVEVVVILMLIMGNGLLAMSELALISARKVRLKQLAEHGNRGARLALELANEPNQFLSTVQIGITLVGILAGAFGGATLVGHLASGIQNVPVLGQFNEAFAVGVVVLAITYLSLVVGELVPKRLALNNAERIASRVARPVQLLTTVASPAVRVLSISMDFVLRILGGKPSSEPPVTEDEIKMLIHQGTIAGVFEEVEANLAANVFRLADKPASALMTPRHEIVWLDIADPPQAIEQMITASAHSRFPVCRDSVDNLIGFVRAKDLLAQRFAGLELNLQAVVRQPMLISESMRALSTLQLFKQTGKHLAMVVDEHGGIEGLVTHHDVLEAIIGTMPWEPGGAASAAVQREDGSWLIDGSMRLDEFKEIFQLKRLPGEDAGTFQTLGGFIMMYLGRIPSIGEHFECGGLRLEVVDMDGRRIDEVLVSRVPQELGTEPEDLEDR